MGVVLSVVPEVDLGEGKLRLPALCEIRQYNVAIETQSVTITMKS